jgi:translation initiation factor 1
MSRRDGTRIVYSTAAGRVCPSCGSPIAECRCRGERDEPVPARVVARVRVEKAGRGGKTVTVVHGLPRNAAFLESLSQELKRACGTGGGVSDGTVQLQGDLSDRIRPVLIAKGITIKG